MMTKRHPYYKIRFRLIHEPECAWHTPVKIVEGDSPPQKTGNPSGWLSRTGVFHSAKFRPYYGARYAKSTLAIEVGIQWCVEHAPEAVVFFAKQRLRGAR